MNTALLYERGSVCMNTALLYVWGSFAFLSPTCGQGSFDCFPEHIELFCMNRVLSYEWGLCVFFLIWLSSILFETFRALLGFYKALFGTNRSLLNTCRFARISSVLWVRILWLKRAISIQPYSYKRALCIQKSQVYTKRPLVIQKSPVYTKRPLVIQKSPVCTKRPLVIQKGTGPHSE